MNRICFASYEIHPVTSGGCGVLLHNSATVLLSQGHEVIFLLDIPEPEFQKFNQQERLKFPHPEHCKAYLVETLCQDFPSPQREDFHSEFEWRAYRFYYASRWVAKNERPTQIEFIDYCGIGYYAMSAKVIGLEFLDTFLSIRLHSSLELIDREQPANIHDLERYLMFGMEHQSLRLAEAVLYPSDHYLNQAYCPYYEPWFGNLECSHPAIVTFPKMSEASKEADGVLFFGRLFGFKGIDIFVDAAVLYLDNPKNPRQRFILAGYDSNLPPDGQGSYQDYLLRKIPIQYQSFFQFTGQIGWKQLEALLPQIMFAVFPGYFESYCYAAHELYYSGIPIIVSNISAFQDAFSHGKNALVFDGTVSDLADQMSCLSNDATLRDALSRPYPIDNDPLGDFYTRHAHNSWMQAQPIAAHSTELLVCILANREEKIDNTFQTLLCGNRSLRVVVVRPVDYQSSETAGWFLGQRCGFYSQTGERLMPTQIETSDALLIIKAGDLLSTEYIPRCLEVLEKQKQINYVGSWKHIRDGGVIHLDTFPLDVASELIPFNISSIYSRYVLRTPPGKLLIDLFDPRANQLGEIAFIWSLETDSTCGATIPEAMISIKKDQDQIQGKILSYLIIRDKNPWRKARLARYLLIKNHSYPIDVPFHSSTNQEKNTSLAEELDEIKGSTAWKFIVKARQTRIYHLLRLLYKKLKHL
jgi:glycosyltransferase involved in cell wall biosynthesis